MNRKDRTGAIGKVTRECDPRLTDAGTGAGRNQWEKLLQNTSHFIPGYIPSHSGRQAVSPLHSQHCNISTTHTVHVTSFYSTSTYRIFR
jgi:hypothetical protein